VVGTPGRLFGLLRGVLATALSHRGLQYVPLWLNRFWIALVGPACISFFLDLADFKGVRAGWHFRMDRTVRRSRWREIEFMYHELCMAILPPHSLNDTFRDWDEISERLAEPSRKRPRYAFH